MSIRWEMGDSYDTDQHWDAFNSDGERIGFVWYRARLRWAMCVYQSANDNTEADTEAEIKHLFLVTYIAMRMES